MGEELLNLHVMGKGETVGPSTTAPAADSDESAHLGRMRRLVDDEISKHRDETGEGASNGVSDSGVCTEEDLSETLID